MKFYKRDPDRALSGMAELTLVQRGAYNSLLDLLYSRDGEVPDDDLRVAKMMTCHWRQWAKAKAELIALGKVWVEGGNLRAKRVQETIKEAADFAQEQRTRAAEGWAKRKSRSENNAAPLPPGNASTATPTATPTDTNISPSKSPRGDFEGFWNVCPRKVGKGAAKRAYAKAITLTDAETLREGMRRYAATRLGQSEQYTVHPATWLNSQRWLDEGGTVTALPVADVQSLQSMWDGRAAVLVDKLGPAHFRAWFSEAAFECGPPVRIIFQKKFQLNWARQHFASEINWAFGDDAELALAMRG